MSKLAIWVRTARLRTLPLSVSGILFGAGLVAESASFPWLLFVLCLFITIGFQVTSNFANDYGDGVKGTDDETRVGPARAIQTGALKPKELLRGIYWSSGISIALVLVLLWKAFSVNQLPLIVLFFALALISVGGALKYTMGKKPYGYQGLGDISVLLFFGLLAVWGTRYVLTQSWNTIEILPAFGIGLLCTAVLNLNNLRDHQSDEAHGKNTLVVQNGFEWGRRYHYSLLVGSLICFLGYLFITEAAPLIYLMLFPYLILSLHLRRVASAVDPARLDPELKVVALSTFFLSLSFFLLKALFS